MQNLLITDTNIETKISPVPKKPANYLRADCLYIFFQFYFYLFICVRERQIVTELARESPSWEERDSRLLLQVLSAEQGAP